MADEKHSWRRGERIYIAVTAAMGCFLGAEIAKTSDAEALAKAYGVFQQEALQQDPNYQPESVNTDGWDATQMAWKAIFPGIALILCFLHSVLGIQQRCRRQGGLYHQVTDKLWQLYHSVNRQQFAQRLRRFTEWAANPKTELPDVVRQKILGLKAKAPAFKVAFDLPNAARTSNAVDRLMNYQDRLLDAMQYFHGSLASANQAVRAMALIWNFHPYCTKVRSRPPYSRSPFQDLNGFCYHEHWLRNLMIAGSLNGRGTAKPSPHKLN